MRNDRHYQYRENRDTIKGWIIRRPVTPSTSGAGYAEVRMAGSRTICGLKGSDLALGLHAENKDGRCPPIGAGAKKALATHTAATTMTDLSMKGFRRAVSLDVIRLLGKARFRFLPATGPPTDGAHRDERTPT